MCGIVGYIGDKQAEPILIAGLKRLEYRGYDSAGLAFIQNQKFSIIRSEGKLNNLIIKLKEHTNPATSGIGHTRWATHGRPSEANAHPHQSKDVVLVHNGIIENYVALKEDLVKKGHKIVSDTDSEVVCHVIQEFLNQKLNFKEAIKKTLQTIQGAFSLVIMNRNDPDCIYAIKKGSPLVVGVKDNEYFVASDIPALLMYTNDMVFMEDGEMAILQRDKVEFFDFAGIKLTKTVKKINWSVAQAEKGGYKHFMLKEIMEQPRILVDTFLGRFDLHGITVNLNDADAWLTEFAHNPHSQIQIIACGTSWHSGLVASYWLESLAKVPVRIDLASEFRYRKPIVNSDTMVIAISQSGETADTLAAIEESKKSGAKILSVCNVIESSIPRHSHATLYTNAGPEIGVASTKAFLTQMAVLYLAAIKIAYERHLLSKDEMELRLQALIELPKHMQSILEKVDVIKSIAEKLCKYEHCYFLGRGIQFPIALEGALKLKEISYIHAEGFAGGEMKHGPIALIDEGIPVVALCLKDHLYEKMVSNIQEVRARGAQVFPVISEDDVKMKNEFEDVMMIPNTHPELLPFLSIIPLQLLSYFAADRKGTDVDQPRNLAKSVTVE